MSEPRQICLSCERVRLCQLHRRASFSPDAAKRWLEQTCPHLNNQGWRKAGMPRCDIHYRSGELSIYNPNAAERNLGA